MALLKRKTPTTYGILDDRGPVIGDCKGNFIGSEWIMNTPSIRVAIFGGVFTRDGAEDRSTAHHVTDGIPGEVLDGNAFEQSLTCYLTTGGYQMPYPDSDNLSVV